MSQTWFRHDTTAFHDRKIQRLFQLGGFDFIGKWWSIVELLSQENDGKLWKQHAEGVAFMLRMSEEDLSAFLTHCVSAGLLAEDSDSYWSNGLEARLEKIRDARDRKRKSRGSVVTAPVTNCDMSQPVTSMSQNVTSPVTKSHSNLLLSNLINSNQIKSNPSVTGGGAKLVEAVATPSVTVAAPPPEPPDPLERYRKFVTRYLSEPSEPPAPWESEPLAMSGGKRPCKKYPKVWLSVNDVLSVFKRYDESFEGDDKGHVLNDALVATQSAAERHVAQGRPLASFNAYSHLVNWKLQDEANTKTAVNRLVKSIANQKAIQ